MAAVAQSDVTLHSNDLIGTASGKVIGARRRFSITMTANGATVGDLTAALLGFATTQIFTARAYRFVTAGLAEANINVTTDGTNIFTFTSIDGSTAAANVTGTLYIEVEGTSL